MQEYNYFKQTGNPEIHAAVVGICKIDWISAFYNTKISQAVDQMKNYEFDILPIENKNGEITHYFGTSTWRKYTRDNISRFEIQSEHLLYYLTNIQDVIRMMYLQKTNFYFLSNHISVIGLITISNLNCKQVLLYYYSLIVNLERTFAKFLHMYLSVDEIVNSLQLVGEEKQILSALETVNRYKSDCVKGLDCSIIEYMYLSDLFILASHHQLYLKLGYKNNKEFEKWSGKLKGLRNIVAHPNKTLITGPDSLVNLWQSDLKIEELVGRLPMNP